MAYSFGRALGCSATAVAATLVSQVGIGMSQGTRSRIDDVILPAGLIVAGAGINGIDSPYAVAAGSAMTANGMVQLVDVASLGRRGVTGRKFL